MTELRTPRVLVCISFAPSVRLPLPRTSCVALLLTLTRRMPPSLQRRQSINFTTTIGSNRFVPKRRQLIPSVNDLRIPRCYYPHPFNEDAVDLVVFSDERGFGAICYLRFKLLDGTVAMAFVMAKSRVAPRQYASMPRLELCGCLLGANLADTVKEEERRTFAN